MLPAHSASSAPAPAVSIAPSVPPPAVAEPSPPDPGDDLVAPARELYRVAACGEAGEVPERFKRAMVDAHCKQNPQDDLDSSAQTLIKELLKKNPK